MTSPPPRPTARLTLGALTALLILGAFTPSVARAGCFNHSVTYRSLLADPHARLELLGDKEPPPVSPVESPGERRRPCTGAFCSGSPAIPTSANPSVSQEGSDPLVIAGLTSSPTDPGGFAFPAEKANFRPIKQSLAIFHPPRSLPLGPNS